MHNVYATVVIVVSVLFVGMLMLLLEWLERHQPFRKEIPWRAWARPILLVLLAFLAGMLRHEFTLPGPPGLVLGGLNLLAVFYGIFRQTVWVTTIEVALIWGVWVFGWTGAHGGMDQSLPAGLFSLIAALCVVGSGLIVAFVKHQGWLHDLDTPRHQRNPRD